jgi:hypothetical protein
MTVGSLLAPEKYLSVVRTLDQQARSKELVKACKGLSASFISFCFDQLIGILRLRNCFAKRSNHSAQDDKKEERVTGLQVFTLR